MEDILKIISFELENTKVRLEHFVERLPIKDRKPIYNRIKKLSRIIETIDFFRSLSKY
jgi:hypothetical protein